VVTNETACPCYHLHPPVLPGSHFGPRKTRKGHERCVRFHAFSCFSVDLPLVGAQGRRAEVLSSQFSVRVCERRALSTEHSNAGPAHRRPTPCRVAPPPSPSPTNAKRPRFPGGSPRPRDHSRLIGCRLHLRRAGSQIRADCGEKHHRLPAKRSCLPSRSTTPKNAVTNRERVFTCGRAADRHCHPYG
jgi:hypothetical protein